MFRRAVKQRLRRAALAGYISHEEFMLLAGLGRCLEASVRRKARRNAISRN